MNEYKTSYKEDFLKLKDKLELSLNRMENEIDYGTMEISEGFSRQGVDLGVNSKSREEIETRSLELKEFCKSLNESLDNDSDQNSEQESESDDDEEFLMINQLKLMRKK